MSLQTRAQYMPKGPQDAIAWVMQRMAKATEAGARAFRFGPQSKFPNRPTAELVEQGSKTNIQVFTAELREVERALYIVYSHISGHCPETSPPALVERLEVAEEILTELEDQGYTEAHEYFVWLREQRDAPKQDTAPDERRADQDAPPPGAGDGA